MHIIENNKRAGFRINIGNSVDRFQKNNSMIDFTGSTMQAISEEKELALPSIAKKPFKARVTGSSFNKKSTVSTKSRFLKKFKEKSSIIEVSDNDSVNSDTKMHHNHTSQLNNQNTKLMKLSEIHQTYL